MTGASSLRWRGGWLCVGWLGVAAVVVLSLVPQPPQLEVAWGDKLQHLAAYAALTAWFIQLYGPGRRLDVAAWLLALGIAIEFLQWLTPYRSFDAQDILADALGVALGCALGALMVRAALLPRVEALLRQQA